MDYAAKSKSLVVYFNSPADQQLIGGFLAAGQQATGGCCSFADLAKMVGECPAAIILLPDGLCRRLEPPELNSAIP